MSYTSSYYSFIYDGSQDANTRAEFVANLFRENELSILDLHAGDGLLSLNLASRQYSVTALEEDPVLFAVLLEKFKSRRDLNPFLTPLPLNLLALETDNTYDLVLLSNALSFIDDGTFSSYISKAYDLLDYEGLLVMNSPLRTSLRQEQPITELYKKVFGFNVISQRASSQFLGHDAMSIKYCYEIYHKNKLVSSFSSQHILHLRNAESIVRFLEENKFKVETVNSGWNNTPLEVNSPNCVVVARKTNSR